METWEARYERAPSGRGHGVPELRDPPDSAPLKNVAFCNLIQRLRGRASAISRCGDLDAGSGVSRGILNSAYDSVSLGCGIPELRSSTTPQLHNCGDESGSPYLLPKSTRANWEDRVWPGAPRIFGDWRPMRKVRTVF